MLGGRCEEGEGGRRGLGRGCSERGWVCSLNLEVRRGGEYLRVGAGVHTRK